MAAGVYTFMALPSQIVKWAMGSAGLGTALHATGRNLELHTGCWSWGKCGPFSVQQKTTKASRRLEAE